MTTTTSSHLKKIKLQWIVINYDRRFFIPVCQNEKQSESLTQTRSEVLPAAQLVKSPEASFRT